MTRPPLILAAALIAATAAVAKDRPVPPATPDGAAVDCVSLPIRQTVVRDDSTIDFFVGSKTYRNTLPNSCPGLGSEKAFSYETSQTRLCSLDIITVYQNSSPGFRRGASCGLGKFQPVTGVKP